MSLGVAASWVVVCKYLSLGLHVGNHSRPTPLTRIFEFVSDLCQPCKFNTNPLYDFNVVL